MENSAQYGVYVIYSEDAHDYESMSKLLSECSKTEQGSSTDILLLRKCLDKDVEDTKRWHVCMRKELYHTVRESGKDHGLTMYIYRANQKHIGSNKTYGYYIPYNTVEMKEGIKMLFSQLEGKYIREGSYTIHEPLPRSDGTDRGYVLVQFEKSGDKYPRPFIRTLRALINDMYIGESKLNVKWCSNSVLKDVIEGATK